MSEAILGSIIVAVLGMIGNIIVATASANKSQAVMETKIEAFEKRTDEKFSDVKEQIENLEKKQDKHNNLVERVAVLERDNKTAFNRIDDLRSDIKDLQKEK